MNKKSILRMAAALFPILTAASFAGEKRVIPVFEGPAPYASNVYKVDMSVDENEGVIAEIRAASIYEESGMAINANSVRDEEWSEPTVRKLDALTYNSETGEIRSSDGTFCGKFDSEKQRVKEQKCRLTHKTTFRSVGEGIYRGSERFLTVVLEIPVSSSRP